MMHKATLRFVIFGIALTLTGCATTTRSSYFIYDSTVSDSAPAHSISSDTTPPMQEQEQDEITMMNAAIQENEAIEPQVIEQPTIQTEIIDIPE